MQSVGFDVNKEELAKALIYDRNQYEKGCSDGYNKAIEDFANELRGNAFLHNFYGENKYTVTVEIVDKIAEQFKSEERNGR